MIETDEVDIDFFTPVASTSLAKIFTNNTKLEDKDNASLKYVPKSIRNVPQKDEESKSTQVIYASAFYGYEWFNNAYISRGKLGAAILKNLKTEQHTMILYDFNKVTLSSTNVSMQLEIDIKENTNLSFYDNNRKYWSIYGAEIQVSTFIEHLKSLNVQVKKSSNTEKGASQTNIENSEENKTISQTPKDNKESDTDSSINKRTKDSILKRMANMGQSVLPTLQNVNLSNSYDSSDSNESNEKVVRHKPQRSNIKNKFFEKVDVTDSCVEIDLNKTSPKLKQSDNIPITSYDHQLVPITSTNIITNPILSNSTELNLFMSEQRISNSELRININRMTDKVDKILETVQGIGDQGGKNVTVSYQNSIVQKLITEYENKIKLYEDFLISQGLDYNSILKASTEQESKSLKHQFDIDVHKNKIKDLQNIIENQNEEISKLRDELRSLEEKCNNLRKEKEDKYNNKTQEIVTLKEELNLKNEELSTLSKTLENTYLKNDINDIKNQLKSIMNKTFHSLSANFDSSENYTGTAVKSLVASVIKKETVEALKEL